MVNNVFTQSLILCLFSFALSVWITPIIANLARRLGLVDDPKKNKHPKVVHTKPTPRGGGVAIAGSVVVASILFLPQNNVTTTIIIGSFLISILGLLDDKFNLHPIPRLLSLFAIALLPVVAGVNISFFTNPLSGQVFNLSNLGSIEPLVSILFSTTWIVSLMLFLNMGAKGLPGQLPGVVTIAAVVVWSLSLRFSGDKIELPIILMSAITAGAFAGFIPMNMYPQRIMPGFSGSVLAGFLLGVLSIQSTAKIGTTLVVLGVPIIDTAFTIIRRIANGKHPIWGDRGHLHHKLMDNLGLKQNQVTYFYWIVTASLGITALNLDAQSKLITLFAIGLILGGFLLTIRK